MSRALTICRIDPSNRECEGSSQSDLDGWWREPNASRNTPPNQTTPHSTSKRFLHCSPETSYTTIYYWCWPQINKTHAWCTYRALSLGARNRECEGSSHCLRVLAVGGSGGVENGALRRALWASDGMSGSWRRPTWRIRGVVGMTVCKLQVMMAGSPSCGHLGMRVDDREVCVFLFLDWIGNCLIWLNVNYQLGWLVV